MRRRLIPVLILADVFSSRIVMNNLDRSLGKSLKSAHQVETGAKRVQRRGITSNPHPGMAGNFADARFGTNEGKEVGGTFWQRRSGVSCVAHGTGKYGDSGRHGAIDRHGEIG